MSGPLEPLAAPQTLAAHTRRAVLAAIADGRLEPGGRYSVAQLAEQLGISRTPVREALLVLEREGRVRFERNKGVRVLETTAADIAEVFELRLLLEVPAAARACGVVDTEALKAARRLVHLPMGRFAEAVEIANAALFLASDESSYITASTFLVDGGLSGAYTTPITPE